MSENLETENLRSPKYGLNVLYHHDQAKLNCEFYAAHANGTSERKVKTKN